jgi:hypothetical protein
VIGLRVAFGFTQPFRQSRLRFFHSFELNQHIGFSRAVLS